MKVLFTADIHIKLGQKNVPKDWAKNRYELLFNQIYDLISKHEIDLLILGGDIFDKIPSLEELELYFKFISKLNENTIIYSGNHEALKKNTTFLTSLKEVSHTISRCAVRIIDEFESIENMDFIPYNKLKEYHPADIDFHGNILFTHVRGEIPPHVKPEFPLELFDRWDLVLAGDLHSHENSQRNIVYPGSPVTTSFHRNKVDTGVIILDSETLKWEWVKLHLPQLIRKTIQVGEEMTPTDYDHTIYEVEGDLLELSSVDSNELLDKKLVNRSEDVALYIEDMTLRQEIEEYLKYIVELNDTSLNEVMTEFSKHEGKLDVADT